VANGGGKALYIDVENLLNTSLLKAVLGEDVKTENIVIVTPDSAEAAFMIAERAIDSKEFDLVVIDSVGAMISQKEKELDFDKDSMMMIPRVVSKFIRRNVYSIRVNNIALLVLNQVRDNVGSYIKSLSSPGGHNLKHQTSVTIMLTRGQELKRGDQVVGIMVKFVIKKNKLAPPFRSFFVPLIFGTGIDYYSDLIEFAKLLGVLQTNGPYYKFMGETLGQGKAATRETLVNSKETVDKIKEQVYNVLSKTSKVNEIMDDIESEGE
jgi:recombination protein RecA